jgi:hypothetical protein
MRLVTFMMTARPSSPLPVGDVERVRCISLPPRYESQVFAQPHQCSILSRGNAFLELALDHVTRPQQLVLGYRISPIAARKCTPIDSTSSPSWRLSAPAIASPDPCATRRQASGMRGIDTITASAVSPASLNSFTLSGAAMLASLLIFAQG